MTADGALGPATPTKSSLTKLGLVFHSQPTLIIAFAIVFAAFVSVFSLFTLYRYVCQLKRSSDNLEAIGALFTKQAEAQLNSLGRLRSPTFRQQNNSVIPREWANPPEPAFGSELDSDTDSHLNYFKSHPKPSSLSSFDSGPPMAAYSGLACTSLSRYTPLTLPSFPPFPPCSPYHTSGSLPSSNAPAAPYAYHMLRRDAPTGTPLDEVNLKAYLSYLMMKAVTASELKPGVARPLLPLSVDTVYGADAEVQRVNSAHSAPFR